MVVAERTESEALVGVEQAVEGVFLDARQLLDPDGLLRAHAHTRAADRLNGQGIDTLYKDFMNKNDVLGSARILRAAEEHGLPPEQFRQNVRREIRTILIEAIQADGHIAPTEIDVTPDGRAHLGGIMFDEMVLRGLHPDHTPALNAFGEIDYFAELMSQAHFRNPTLRQGYAQVRFSLIPNDRERDQDKLLNYGFKLENGGWMIDFMHFEPKGAGWQRKTQRLFMSGSDPRVGSRLLAELGITDGAHLSTMAIRETSVLVSRDAFPDGPVGMGRIADMIMAGSKGRPVFCGKERDWQPTDADYDALAAESQEREASVEDHVDILSDVAYHLAGNGQPFADQSREFANAIIHALRDICKNRPEYAEYAFGIDAMRFYLEAKDKREAGDIAGADQALRAAHEHSQTTFICDLEIVFTDKKGGMSPFASLEEKYGSHNVEYGVCRGCGVKGKVLAVGAGKCGGFCNGCDTRDKLIPGYIEDMMKRKRQQQKAGSFAGILSSIWFGGLERGARTS